MRGFSGDDSEFREKLLAALRDPSVVAELHNYSDVLEPTGQHHVLGIRHDEASYGDHAHTGKDSSLVTGIIKSTDADFCSVWKTTAPVIPNATWTEFVNYDTVNQGGAFAYAGAGTLTVPLTGFYEVIAHATFAGNATGTRHIQIRLNSGGNVANGTQLAYASTLAVSTNSVGLTAETFGVHYGNVGDSIDVYVFQDSGGVLALLSGLPGGHAYARPIKLSA